jgi:SagB-type dehydrogenase family enzyme
MRIRAHVRARKSRASRVREAAYALSPRARSCDQAGTGAIAEPARPAIRMSTRRDRIEPSPPPSRSRADVVLAYHERSKHRPGAYARSLGYDDWDTQPSPFRVYDGAPNVLLDEVPVAETARLAAERGAVLGPAYDELFLPGCIAPAAMTFESVSQLLYDSLALAAWKQSGRTRWSLRVNPSNGNLQPTEAYLVLPALRDVGPRPAVYHYSPLLHALEERRHLSAEDWEELAIPLPTDGLLVGLTSIVWRQAWKFGERAFRYCQHDLGHAIAAISLAAACLGWGVRRVSGLTDDELALLVGVHKQRGVEAELPQILLAIAPGLAAVHDKPAEPFLLPAPSSGFVDRARAAAWSGVPNALSAGHHDWPILAVVANATRESGARATLPPPGSGKAPALPQPEPDERRTFDDELPLAFTRTIGSKDAFARAMVPGLEPTLKLIRAANDELSDPWRKASAAVRPPRARVILRKRRSALDMDGKTRVGKDTFARMLARTLPRPGHPVFDALARPVAIHLVLFVHRVRELPGGLYLLARDRAALPMLREALSPSFVWERVEMPHELALFRLERGDTRALARTSSCHQSIASNAAFTVAMIGEFEPRLRAAGAPLYRALHWEAGAIGQVLYGEAEAASLRATGLGWFFDDAVHEALGLRDRSLQALYHFAVGVAVDDKRVLTQPPYAHRRHMLEG